MRSLEAETLTVGQSAGLGHGLRAQCGCGRSRVLDVKALSIGWAPRTWRSVLQEQLLVCRQCGRPAETLAISFAPEPFHTLRRR